MEGATCEVQMDGTCVPSYTKYKMQKSGGFIWPEMELHRSGKEIRADTKEESKKP